MLENRDYTLIIDKSGSMATKDKPGGSSRWQIMQESTLALASKCEEFDPDGMTVYLFSGKFKRYDNVTAAKVAAIFQENDPSGRTDLATVLGDAVDNYFQRKAAGQVPANGEIILVVTDGEPDDRKAVMQVILNASQKLEAATKFLKILDDDLGRAGAKFDIVDTITMNDMEDLTLKEVLLSAIND
jgi:uncharacterized protein with von Willebrand factor type A (vWA) domain